MIVSALTGEENWLFERLKLGCLAYTPSGSEVGIIALKMSITS